jgi:uncharacterized membrane protein
MSVKVSTVTSLALASALTAALVAVAQPAAAQSSKEKCYGVALSVCPRTY